MAQINVGDVTFGLGADIRGLDKARTAMQAFGKETDRIARLQAQGAEVSVAAYAKQEAAMRKALNTTVLLQNQLRQSGGSAAMIGQTTNSLNALTKALGSGELNASQYSRAMDRFKVSTDKVKSTLKTLEGTHSQATTTGNRFSTMLKDLQSASVLAVGPLSGVGTRISAFSAITSRSTLALGGFVLGVTAVGVALFKMSSAAIKTELEIQRINSALYASAGTTTATANEFNYVVGVSKKLGLELSSTAQAYSQFTASVKGTNIEGAEAKKIFEGTATAASALKLSAADTEGVFRALTQMMSKGTVQAEELRGQLGDRIPGAFRDAAAAMGVSEQKLGQLMKKGEVLSEDLLPKLAERWKAVYGDAAAKSADGLQAAMNNAATAQTLFNVAFNETFGISEAVTKSLKAYASVLDYLTGKMNTSEAAVMKFGEQVSKDTATFLDDQKKVITASRDRVEGYIADVADMKYQSTMLTNKLKDDLATQIEMQKELSSGFTGKLAQWGGGTDKRDAEIKATQEKIAQQEALVAKAKEQLDLLNKLKTKTNEKGATGTKPTANDNTGSPKLDKLTEINDALKVTQERTAAINAMPDYWLQGSDSLRLFNKQLERGKQLEAFKDKLILAGVSQDVFNQKVKAFNETMAANDVAELRLKKIEDRAKALDEIGGTALDHFGGFLEDLNDETKSFGDAWSSMVDGIIKDLQRWAIQQSVIQPLKDLIGGSSGTGADGIFGSVLGAVAGAFGSSFGSSSSSYGGVFQAANANVNPQLTSTLDSLYNSSVILPGRARGGNVNAGKPYMVGENGPEPFIPNSSGKILPTDFMSGTQVNITINNNNGSKVTQSQDSSGRNIEISIDEMVAKQISTVGTRSNKAVRTSGNRIAGR